MLATKLDSTGHSPQSLERDSVNQTALKVSYAWPPLPVDLSPKRFKLSPAAGVSGYELWDAKGFTADQLFAAWCVLLQRYSRLEEFAVGVGLALGVQVLTVEVPSATGAADVETQLKAAYAQRQARVHPSVTAGIAFTTRQDKDVEVLRAEWDLDVLAAYRPSGSGCALEVAVHPTRFRSLPPAELVKRWAATAQAIRAHGTAPLTELPLLGAEEAAKQRALLRGPEEAHPMALPHAAFSERALANPNAVAIDCDGVQWTYAKLEQRSNQIARWLLRQNPTTEPQRVLVSMEPCCEFLACLLAIFKLGYTHVPLDPAYPVARQKVIVEDTQPLLLFTQKALQPQLLQLGARTVVADGDVPEFDAEPSEPLDLVDARERTAYIIYTSGTTGRPKGVEITYGNLAHYIDVARDMYGYSSKDVIPAMARSSFSITFFELLSPLVVGGKLLFLNRADVLDTAKMLTVLQTVSCIHASPALWRRLLAHIKEIGLGPEAFTNLRHASSGGDMVPPDVLESMFRLSVNVTDGVAN